MSKVDPGSPADSGEARRRPARGSKLSEEIRIVRAMIRQAQSMTNEASDTGELLSVLETVSRACTSLATMLKTEKALDESQTAADYVKAALDEIRAEMELEGIDSVLTSGL